MPESIKFLFKESAQYRVVSASGAFGGITPRGDQLFISFFMEHFPMPESVTHTLSPDGVLGAENMNLRIPQNDPGVIVREHQTAVVMSVESAKEFSNWLNSKLEEIEKARQLKDLASVEKQ